MEIIRKKYLHELGEFLRAHLIVAILGPRQCGKTTLAKQHLAKRPDPAGSALVLKYP